VVLNMPDFGASPPSGVFGTAAMPTTMQSQMQAGIGGGGSMQPTGMNLPPSMGMHSGFFNNGPPAASGGSSMMMAAGMMGGSPMAAGLMSGGSGGGRSGMEPIMGAGGGGLRGYHPDSDFHTGGGREEKSCVLLVYGLESPRWNCDRLFNLLCPYGNVNRIFFMKSKPSTAMVEMGSHEGLDNVVRHLQGSVCCVPDPKLTVFLLFGSRSYFGNSCVDKRITGIAQSLSGSKVKKNFTVFIEFFS
jgi:hypothetical protein